MLKTRKVLFKGHFGSEHKQNYHFNLLLEEKINLFGRSKMKQNEINEEIKLKLNENYTWKLILDTIEFSSSEPIKDIPPRSEVNILWRKST